MLLRVYASCDLAEGGWESFPLIRPCGATFPQRGGEGLESIKKPAT